MIRCILLGPSRAGKSTVGKLLSAQLGVPYLHLDSVDAASILKEFGFDEAAMKESWSGGWEGFYRYQQPFAAHLFERALPELQECILEIDAPTASFEEPELLARAQRALQPYANVVLLLPSPDLDASMRVLEERGHVLFDGVPMDEHFVKHHSNHDLAKLVVYSKGKTPEETCEEIVARIDLSEPVILLIGPMRAGKSTLGHLLSERLKRPRVPMDHLRWDYYKEIGWNEAEQQRIREAEGFAGVYRYWKPFELHAVGRLLADHREGVIDFGAGHSVYEKDADFARARELLAPYPNVVLLLPSPDPGESVAILRERGRQRIGGVEVSRFFTTHLPKLAKQTVYTEGKTPDETSREIAAGLA
jgi:shikimate kinase